MTIGLSSGLGPVCGTPDAVGSNTCVDPSYKPYVQTPSEVLRGRVYSIFLLPAAVLMEVVPENVRGLVFVGGVPISVLAWWALVYYGFLKGGRS